jgi:hypothetical protein
MTDSSPKQATSLLEAIALAEASAFRITPTYLYAFKYKDGNKSLGLVPVHIKHPNVPKHIFDLVDPEPGTPLANTVIGTIPKHYKAATDLVLKDANKTLKDVLTKDGASDDTELLHPPKSAPTPVTKADVQAALGGTASVPLDAYLHAVQFNQDPATDLKLLKNPQVTATLLKVYGANWKEKAAALGFAVPGVVTVKSEVANAAKILNFSTGSEEFKALAALHEFGNMIDAVAEVNGEDASEEVFDKNYLTFEKVIALAKKAGLATADEDDDGIVTVKFKPMATSPMLVPAPTPPVTSVPPPPVTSTPAPPTPAAIVPPGFSVLDLAALNNQPEAITIQNPKGVTFVKSGGKWWFNGIHAADTSALVGQSFKVVRPFKGPSTAPFEYDSPAPASPTPTATPTAPITSGGLGLPAIPPLATLSSAGDAKASLGGAHPKQFVKDAAGNTFLFKPGADAPALAAAAYANIAAKVFGAENAVPVVVGNVSGVGTGSIQPMVPNIKTDLSKVDLTALTHPQLARLMQERVLDWALASHDAKAGNFLLTTDGNVVGIDKDQSLKFIGKDSLDTSYKPNPSPLIYGTLFDLFKKKKIDLPIGDMLPAIEKIEDISDDAWLANLGSYLGAKGGSAKELTTLKDEILKRKKNVRKDLEAFITGVYQERGDIGMTDTFEFEAGKDSLATKVAKKKKKDLGGLSVPPMGSVLSPPQLPSISSLVPEGAASGIGGAGEKFFFAGPDGKYLVKLARSKNKAKIEPFRIAAQEMFSQVSSVVRPGKSIPVGNVPEGYKGIPASIQPWMAGATPLGAAGTNPSLLTDSERKDVAEEHALDWLMSQHDTHAANFVRRPDGALLSVDKEQGFKFMLPGTTDSVDGDKLAIDYHPNKVENEPYYNKFWKAFADGSMSFDPKEMTGAIERIEAISDSDYTQLLSKFASEAKFKDDPKKVAEFLDRALARKQNIRKDFESFIGGLYAKRTKKKGTFTFAGGWSEAGAEPKKTPPPPAVVQGAKPIEVVNPLQTGILGAVGVETVSQTTPPPTVKATPTPPGFAAPAPGFQWNVSKASAFFGTGSPNFYKEKPPKVTDGSPDTFSDFTVIKMQDVTVEKVEESFKQAGVTLAKKPVSKDGKVVVFLPKDDWAKAKGSDAQIGFQEPIPAAPEVQGLKTIPKAGQLKNAVLDRNILDVDFRKEPLAYGQPVIADGPSVEGQTIMVQRQTDAKGKTFYRYVFKFRKSFTEGANALVKDGAPSVFNHQRTAYSAATDSLEHKGGPEGKTDKITSLKWTDGNNIMHMGSPSEPRWAVKNRVWADVYPKPGEDPNDAFAKLLDKAGPNLSSKVLKAPTPEEEKTMKLSALYWMAAPQAADALPESQRTSAILTDRLKKLGYSDAEMNSIRMEKVGFGAAVPVLPGRLARIRAANPDFAYMSHAISSPANVVKMLRTGPTGIMGRQDTGLQPKGTSTSADNAPDQNSGGGDYLFVKPVTKSLANSGTQANGWGDIEIIADPSELDRLDIFTGNSGDPYGNVHSPAFTTRQTVDSPGFASRAEVVFKQGWSPNKILKVRTQTAARRQEVISALKEAGITVFNGMPIEDLVVTESSGFYDKQLKPAGY